MLCFPAKNCNLGKCEKQGEAAEQKHNHNTINRLRVHSTLRHHMAALTRRFLLKLSICHDFHGLQPAESSHQCSTVRSQACAIVRDQKKTLFSRAISPIKLIGFICFMAGIFPGNRCSYTWPVFEARTKRQPSVRAFGRRATTSVMVRGLPPPPWSVAAAGAESKN